MSLPNSRESLHDRNDFEECLYLGVYLSRGQACKLCNERKLCARTPPTPSTRSDIAMLIHRIMIITTPQSTKRCQFPNQISNTIEKCYGRNRRLESSILALFSQASQLALEILLNPLPVRTPCLMHAGLCTH